MGWGGVAVEVLSCGSLWLLAFFFLFFWIWGSRMKYGLQPAFHVLCPNFLSPIRVKEGILYNPEPAKDNANANK